MSYEPIRGGTRGGQGDFKWSEVSSDKDREHYLGHSINAPTGRWQKNKDIHWYNREKKQTDNEKAEELAKIKEAEKEALSIALGFKPSKPVITNGSNEASTSGANAIPVTGKRKTRSVSVSDAEEARSDDQEEGRDEEGDQKLSKEDKRLRKLEKKLAKAEKKRLRREEKEARAMARVVHEKERDSDRPRLHHNRERSASPRRGDRSYGRRGDRHRNDDDDGKDYGRNSPRRERERKPYSEEEMKKERERDRKRWEDNLERQERARGN